MVPTGTFRRMSAPSRPVLLEPSPWRPRSALYSGLKRKWTRVLWRSLDSMKMSPPLPPSPPEGPPRGTNFSRRKATQPLPPSPAFTRIVASSMNIDGHWSLAQGQIPKTQRQPLLAVRRAATRLLWFCEITSELTRAAEGDVSAFFNPVIEYIEKGWLVR